MKNEKNAWKSIIVITAVLSVLAIAMVGTAAAKSVYLSANHHTAQFDAWNINQPGGTVTYQATYILQHSTDPSGIACDAIPKDASVLFISSEFSAGIEMVNPITLEYMGVSSGPSDLAGVDVDDVDNIVYTLRRQTNDLYIYSWDPVAKQLTQQAVIDLPGMSNGYGLALDDSRDILWVSDTPNWMVRAYDVDVSNWNDIAEIPTLSRKLSLPVIDVAVDTKRNLVHTVGSWAGSRLLSKYDVAAGTETTIDLGVGGIGVAVDEDTGYVYITRGTSSAGDDIQVWNTSTSPFTLVQDTPRIGNPAGICICNVAYNPLNLSKSDGLAEDECVSPGANINYDICYDNMRNAFDVHNVTINDTLPAETSFISASGGGTYDPVTHTVTWNIGTLSAGAAEDCVQLVVRVDPATLPETTITNYCTIDSDETPPTTISEDTVTCKQNPLWHEINRELDELIDKVSAADMPSIIKRRLIGKLEYAKVLKDNAKIECEDENFDYATKKLGVAKNQMESFERMVKRTRRISPADKASFLAESAKIIEKIDELIKYIKTEHRC